MMLVPKMVIAGDTLSLLRRSPPAVTERPVVKVEHTLLRRG